MWLSALKKTDCVACMANSNVLHLALQKWYLNPVCICALRFLGSGPAEGTGRDVKLAGFFSCLLLQLKGFTRSTLTWNGAHQNLITHSNGRPLLHKSPTKHVQSSQFWFEYGKYPLFFQVTKRPSTSQVPTIGAGA